MALYFLRPYFAGLDAREGWVKIIFGVSFTLYENWRCDLLKDVVKVKRM